MLPDRAYHCRAVVAHPWPSLPGLQNRVCGPFRLSRFSFRRRPDERFDVDFVIEKRDTRLVTLDVGDDLTTRYQVFEPYERMELRQVARFRWLIRRSDPFKHREMLLREIGICHRGQEGVT